MSKGITKATRQKIEKDEKAAVKLLSTNDSYQNFAARLGVGTNNLSSDSTYGFNPITRNRTILEWMYRGSWIVGKAVDCIAEDMTKAGIQFLGDNNPKDTEKLTRGFTRHSIWTKVQEGVKWSRLYGGAIIVIMIDGQKFDTPLRVESIGKGQFKGLKVLDRWMVEPSLEDLVDDFGSEDFGNPRYYRVTAQSTVMSLPSNLKIHHSRVIRLIGVELPFWQKVSENLWGMSVVERIYDRLIAFDSSTAGASQLMYRAHLRTMKIPKLREIIAAGGKALDGLVAQMEFIRRYQSSEGINMIDALDDFTTQSYTFGGVAETILQFGQQLSGALDTPLVRLFGQSPAGLNATGESDLRTYYDGIEQRQETTLRNPFHVIINILARSMGITLDDAFDFAFNPLWQLSDEQKATVSSSISTNILSAESQGVISRFVALKELRQQSRLTGIFTNITDEDLKDAEDEPPPSEKAEMAMEMAQGGGDEEGDKGKDEPTSTNDSLSLIEVGGLPIVIETARGTRRQGNGWSVVMPCDYGYFRGTDSAEGHDEQLDCFVGPNPSSTQVWVVNQSKLDGSFDEHKVLIGFDNADFALATYHAAFSDTFDRAASVVSMSLDQFKSWMATSDKSKEAT
jgi:phage-related protein (TIGR01555 family)